MVLIDKVVPVPASFETVVKSVVDLAHTVKGGGDFGALLTDLVADIQAVPQLGADLKADPFAAAKSVFIGFVDIAKVVLS